MEDPIHYDAVDGGVCLPEPPFDPNFDLFPDGDVIIAADDDDGFPFNVDFDFTFDDLSFADNLLLDPNSVSPGSDSRVTTENPSEGGVDGGGVRVYDCETPEANQGPISSEESNFGEKSRCDSPEIGSSKTNSGGFSGNSSDCDVCSSLIDNSNANLSDDSGNNVELEQKVKVEGELFGCVNDEIKNNDNKSSLKSKRKKEARECEESNVRSSKCRKSSSAIANVEENGGESGGEDSKRIARLMRNRESAQLSRQRKKLHVEELEEKVKSMHNTITYLNSQISGFMAENAALRQQLSGGVPAGAVPGMYPGPPHMAPMPYPWMPCPPYMMKPQGSNVLVPIPRLKPQAPAPAPKAGKRSSKGEGKTKKVASVSLLGLLFFMLLFGGLVPMVNVRYSRGVGDGVKGSGTVFVVDNKVGHHSGRVLHESNGNVNVNGSIGGNTSEPLVASLYVPRNDKMVKIDGNLIIHSVLASEKAMRTSSKGEGVGGKASEETSLAIHGSSYPPYPTPRPGSNNWRSPHLDRNLNGRQGQKALGSGSSDGFTPIGSDGKLQEWFREGLAGPMLSSGMCTEVFQFDVSPTPGSIVPASSINITSGGRQNSTRANRSRNRRILHGSLNDYTFNTTDEQVQPHEQNDGLQSNKSSSPMIVSVLVDPREVGDGDGEGVIGSKTLSRIFVVVLIDSVKYVTYSCMLPFMGSGSHLVTT